jgi:5-methylcytosine-specific restriction endonuclease McrA
MVIHRDRILELRAQGKSYNEIVLILGCSKGTIAFHCGKDQKKKHADRSRKNREKSHPYKKKIDTFFFNSRRSKNKTKQTKSTIDRLIYAKVHGFCKIKVDNKEISMKTNFTVDDVINKFGKNPTCYLSGDSIDIYRSKTYEFDHIIPRSRGGTNDIDNLGICTREVNQSKRDMTPDEFINLCKKILEYNGYVVSKN